MRLSALTAALGRFLAELQRRKVLRVAATYLVAGWIVLQVAVALQTAMSLSPSFSAAILALLVIGFPAALVLTWFFEITPEGIKRTPPALGEAPPFKPQTTDLILAGALALVLVVAAVQLATPPNTASAPAAVTVEGPKPPALGDKSIAVLPFANLSTSPQDAVFSDGLTEEVLNILGRIHGLRVISRTSSFAFKGKDTPLPEIAKQLGVRHILEGSVRRDGDTIRITAQLIDVTSDTHLWSQTFERKAENVFAAQDEISRAVGLALNVELSVSDGGHGAPTQNMEAYRLFLKAREEFVELTRASALSSIELYKRAIALDPKFAEAYAHLAMVYASIGGLDPTLSRAFALKARESATAALKLNPNLATAYAALSGLARFQLDWEASIGDARKAIELEPSNFEALQKLGFAQLLEGSFEEATRTFEELEHLDPLFGAGTFNLLLAAFARGDDAAVVTYGTKLRTGKGLSALAANMFLATVAQDKGDHAQAEKIIRWFGSNGTSKTVTDTVIAALRSSVARGDAVKALKEEASRNPTFDPRGVYVLIGAYDPFLDALNVRLTDKDAPLDPASLFYVWHLVLHGEGTNPRFKDFLRNIGLVDYWKKHGWPDHCRAKGEDDFECS